MNRIQVSQIAGMNEHFKRYTLEYFLDSMVELGIENIELWAASPHLYMEDVSYNEVVRIRKEIERRQLNLICVTPEQCIYPVNIAAKETDVRVRSVNYFLNSLKVTAELGANMLQIVPGKGYYDEPVEEAWKRSRESLAIISKKAEELEITVVLEPLERKESNLIPNLTALNRMLKEVSSPHLKAVVDTCPMAAAGETIDDYFKVLGKDLRHIHFADSNHLTLGDGTLPLATYVDQIGSNDYAGFVTLEIVSNKYISDPAGALKRALKYLESATN